MINRRGFFGRIFGLIAAAVFPSYILKHPVSSASDPLVGYYRKRTLQQFSNRMVFSEMSQLNMGDTIRFVKPVRFTMEDKAINGND